jgi:acetolactate synthase-1/2/3 large subunit
VDGHKSPLPWLHGGDLVAQQLANEGVEYLFTLTGGHISPLYDGARFVDIKLVDFRHEQAAVHAADGFARITRRPACAALTAGPGVTGGITGVANAYYAQSPVLVLGGRNPFMTEGAGNLQDAPHLEMMRPVTKFCASIYDTWRAREVVHEALRSATTPRFGPAYVDLPMDMQLTRIPTEEAPPLRNSPLEKTPAANDDLVEATARLLAKAKRPVILAGSGLHWANGAGVLGRFAEILKAPVYLNGMARGALGRRHPSLLMKARGATLAAADLVLMLGADFDFRLNYGQRGVIPETATVIQVDPDRTCLSRNRDVQIAVCADIRAFLEALLKQDGRYGRAKPIEWVEALREKEAVARASERKALSGTGGPIHPKQLAYALADYLDEDAIVIGDGGDIVATFASLYQPGAPGSWLDPGPFGCLGVGAPFAIGARLAAPDRQIAVLFGDGAFGFNGFEFDSAVRQNLPFVGIIGNDGAWSEMRTFHEDMFGPEDPSAQYLDQSTAYEKVVEALGGYGERVTSARELKPALERAFASGVPAILNVIIDPTVRREAATISGRHVAAAYGEGDPDAFRRTLSRSPASATPGS